MKKQVKVEIKTIIDNDGEKEYGIVKQSGIIFHKGEMTVLRFTEKQEDNGVVHNMITIQADKVNVKRSGSVEMNQQFQLHRVTETVFRHVLGNIHMETYTNAIKYQSSDEDIAGQLFIDYNVKLNGQTERQHHLELTFEEDDL